LYFNVFPIFDLFFCDFIPWLEFVFSIFSVFVIIFDIFSLPCLIFEFMTLWLFSTWNNKIDKTNAKGKNRMNDWLTPEYHLNTETCKIHPSHCTLTLSYIFTFTRSSQITAWIQVDLSYEIQWHCHEMNEWMNDISTTIPISSIQTDRHKINNDNK
jgi:hypothetical protein